MSLGVDALLLVALCGTASWLLGRRRRAESARTRPPLPDRRGDSAAELHPGAVISLGPGAEDFVITQVERLPSDAPLALICHLDGGGPGGQAVLLLPRGDALAPVDSRRCWLLRKLPRSSFWLHSAAEPPLQCDHDGDRYALSARYSDAGRPGATREELRRIATYRGPGQRRLLLVHWGQAEHAYVGTEQPMRSLDILPIDS